MKQIKTEKVTDKKKKKVPLTLESIQQLITRHKEVEEGKRLASVGGLLIYLFFWVGINRTLILLLGNMF